MYVGIVSLSKVEYFFFLNYFSSIKKMPVKTDKTSVTLRRSVHSELRDPVSHRLSNLDKFQTLNCKWGDNTCVSLTM